jgi:MFS family permease
MQRSQTNFLFLNIGHFLAHYFMLIFATAAALRLTTEWGLSYAELIPYATPAFVAFGIGAIPAGWLADRWSRQGMMVTFFLGIGASAVIAGMADSPSQIGFGLLLIGVFAAIYHPVGLAMVVHGRIKTGIPLAINGVFGNMGVASAALFTGYLIDTSGWRSAFVLSGLASILLGMLYLLFLRTAAPPPTAAPPRASIPGKPESRPIPRRTLLTVFGVIFFTAAMGGLVFQSTTFTLPKVLAERLADNTETATIIGWYAFLVFSVAGLAQLVVGYLVDKHSVRSVFAWVALLQALFFFVMTQTGGVLSLFVAIAFMLAVFGQVPINDVLVGRMARSEWHSRAFAARYIVTFSVSATAVPLIAWIHGTWGFNTLFGLLTVAALLIFLAVLILPKPERSAQTDFFCDI